jgi:hypothetical protein
MILLPLKAGREGPSAIDQAEYDQLKAKALAWQTASRTAGSLVRQ